jgi:BCCT family betaine/carnitine transporter
MLKIKINPQWNISVLLITFSFLIILSSYVLSNPKGSAEFLKSIYDFFAVNFETYFLIIGFIVLIFLLAVSFLPIGSKKLILEGKDTFSYFSWGSMLFATGLGAALLYWSTVEWLVYFTDPMKETSIQDPKNFLNARTYPLFHWGFTGWAIYCLPAVAFALALINKPNSPLTFSGILLQKQSGILRIILDLIFIGAILTGAGVGLTLSFPLISAIISEIFSINKNIYLDFSALILCLFIFGTSVYLGIQKGIKRLSNLNIILVIFFLIFILVTGPTFYIIENTFEPLGYMFKSFFNLSLETSKYSITWTVFYWAWYFALAPAVGTFIVNVSSGKTIREIILGSLLIGSFGGFFHVGVLSNSSIYLFENGILNSPELYKENMIDLESIVVETVSSLNYGYFLLIPFGIISIIFLCTTYDSSSYILATAAMKNFKNEPSRNLRLFFAFMLVIQPALIMFLGGGDSFMWLLVIFSVPLIFINLLLIISIVKNAIKFRKS